MTLDNLTQLQKAAIEGEVAKAFSTARHNSEILYRIYIILRHTPEEFKAYIPEILKEFIELDPMLVQRVVFEATAEEVPIWLWVDKVIADIKLSIKLATMDGMICDIDADKKLIQKKIVKSAFVFFVRKTAMLCTKAAKDLCLKIMNEENLELDFLEDVCFTLIPKIEEMEQTEVMPLDAFHTEFDIRDTLSFKVEKEILEPKEEKKPKPSKYKEVEMVNLEKNGMEVRAYRIDLPKNEKAVSDAVNQIMEELIKKGDPGEEKATKYAVTKEYSNSPVSTTLKTFDTEAEAESYKEQLEKGYPELMKSCRIKVKKVR